MDSGGLYVRPGRFLVSTRVPSRISVPFLSLLLVGLSVFSMAGPPRALATPDSSAFFAARAQNVDWMTSSQAASLDLPFSVMVPTFIPAPFSGSPAMSGSGDYYSLYWVNYGGPPTFLLITGEVGGTLPAGSPADLNIQLSVNASVQGNSAIHDVTSIYDNVWWIAGGVLYTVSSNNMTGSDSLSLANSLIELQPPVTQELEPVEPTSAPVQPTTAPSSQPDSEENGEPPTQPEPEVNDTTDDPGSAFEEVLEDTIAVAESGETGVGGVADPDLSPSVATDDLTDALSGSITLSDGTAGAALPSGGDGTGGIRQIAIP